MGPVSPMGIYSNRWNDILVWEWQREAIGVTDWTEKRKGIKHD